MFGRCRQQVFQGQFKAVADCLGTLLNEHAEFAVQILPATLVGQPPLLADDVPRSADEEGRTRRRVRERQDQLVTGSGCQVQAGLLEQRSQCPGVTPAARWAAARWWRRQVIAEYPAHCGYHAVRQPGGKPDPRVGSGNSNELSDRRRMICRLHHAEH